MKTQYLPMADENGLTEIQGRVLLKLVHLHAGSLAGNERARANEAGRKIEIALFLLQRLRPLTPALSPAGGEGDQPESQ